MTGRQARIRIAACALAALAGSLSAAAIAKVQTTPFGLNPADQGAFLQPANPERESPRMFSKSKHGGRIADWRLHHADGAGRVPDDAQTRNLRAFEEFVKKRGRAKAAGIAPDRWTALGGGPVGGRIRAILPHPADANTLWLGAATGGVWKTTDGGASWRAVGDNIASLTVSTMVIDAANTLYIGTGEWSQGHFGAGVFRSDDGGATWQFLPATDPGANNHWRYVSRMVAHPTQPGVIIAGTWRGIYRTADGGATWTRVHRLTPIGSESFFNHAHDIDFDPNNASRMTAGLVGGAVALSADAGLTWQMQPIADIAIDLEGDTAQRVELAYARSRPGRIYALVDRRSGDLFRSDDGGANWELMSNPKVLAEQGNYDNTLWVDPFDDKLVIAGGVDLVRSTDGGATWKAFQSGTATSAESYRTISNTRTVIHPDFHWIVAAAGYDGAANRRVYLGGDGGVFRIEDARTNLFDSVLQPNGWQRLNGDSLRVTQFYGVAASPDPNPYLAGGAQDNGVVFSTQGAGAATLRIASGDGMSPASTRRPTRCTTRSSGWRRAASTVHRRRAIARASRSAPTCSIPRAMRRAPIARPAPRPRPTSSRRWCWIRTTRCGCSPAATRCGCRPTRAPTSRSGAPSSRHRRASTTARPGPTTSTRSASPTGVPTTSGSATTTANSTRPPAARRRLRRGHR
ncbi:MAG: hypothetical protein IPM02_06895 [Betaproteobacteria bacterium]|nr:hypothetical protein [Betaproteobacteria bacterium]